MQGSGSRVQVARVQGCASLGPTHVQGNLPLPCLPAAHKNRLTEEQTVYLRLYQLLIYIHSKGRINTKQKSCPARSCNTTLDITEGAPSPHYMGYSHLAQERLQHTLLIHHTSPTSPLMFSLTSGSRPDSASHPLSVLLLHPVSAFLCPFLPWPHAAAMRSKETALGGTQTFPSVLFAWS